MLRRTLQRLFPARTPVLASDALQDFLRSRAAFISQKAMYEYCRARAGVMWDKLMLEAAFVTELERGRWQAFIAALSDQAVVAELAIRPHATGTRYAAAVAELAVGVITDEPRIVAAGLAIEPAAAEIRLRVAEAAAAPARKVYQIAERSGGRIFALLPLHASVRRYDEAMVVNSVRFLMIRAYEDLVAAMDGPRLVADLERLGREL